MKRLPSGFKLPVAAVQAYGDLQREEAAMVARGKKLRASREGSAPQAAVAPLPRPELRALAGCAPVEAAEELFQILGHALPADALVVECGSVFFAAVGGALLRLTPRPAVDAEDDSGDVEEGGYESAVGSPLLSAAVSPEVVAGAGIDETCPETGEGSPFQPAALTFLDASDDEEEGTRGIERRSESSAPSSNSVSSRCSCSDGAHEDDDYCSSSSAASSSSACSCCSGSLSQSCCSGHGSCSRYTCSTDDEEEAARLAARKQQPSVWARLAASPTASSRAAAAVASGNDASPGGGSGLPLVSSRSAAALTSVPPPPPPPAGSAELPSLCRVPSTPSWEVEAWTAGGSGEVVTALAAVPKVGDSAEVVLVASVESDAAPPRLLVLRWRASASHPIPMYPPLVLRGAALEDALAGDSNVSVLSLALQGGFVVALVAAGVGSAPANVAGVGSPRAAPAATLASAVALVALPGASTVSDASVRLVSVRRLSLRLVTLTSPLPPLPFNRVVAATENEEGAGAEPFLLLHSNEDGADAAAALTFTKTSSGGNDSWDSALSSPSAPAILAAMTRSPCTYPRLPPVSPSQMVVAAHPSRPEIVALGVASSGGSVPGLLQLRCAATHRVLFQGVATPQDGPAPDGSSSSSPRPLTALAWSPCGTYLCVAFGPAPAAVPLGAAPDPADATASGSPVSSPRSPRRKPLLPPPAPEPPSHCGRVGVLLYRVALPASSTSVWPARLTLLHALQGWARHAVPVTTLVPAPPALGVPLLAALRSNGCVDVLRIDTGGANGVSPAIVKEIYLRRPPRSLLATRLPPLEGRALLETPASAPHPAEAVSRLTWGPSPPPAATLVAAFAAGRVTVRWVLSSGKVALA